MCAVLSVRGIESVELSVCGMSRAKYCKIPNLLVETWIPGMRFTLREGNKNSFVVCGS